MARVTSKLQVTIPKRVAQQYGIRPGDELAFVPAGEAIRVVPAESAAAPDAAARLELFERATARQRARPGGKRPRGRGWTRAQLYERGRAR